MKSTSSLLEKKEIIKSIEGDSFITRVLYYTYNPYFKYHVTSKNCKKYNNNYGDSTGQHLCNEYYLGDLFCMLDNLSNRVWTGHEAISYVNGLVENYSKYADLIYNILDRNLELRASDSVINKVIPNLIPTFDVALATKYEPKFCDFENETWLSSRKLDGVRCIIRKEDGEVKAYSRQGNEFTTIQKVLDDVALMSGDFVLDGEICMMDDNGNEDFQGIMKQIKRKDHTIEKPKYVVFDYLSLKEFDTKEGDMKLSERIKELKDVIFHDGYYTTLSVLDQVIVKDEEHLSEMIAEADKMGHEGVMLRKDVGYEGKRSKNLLKCKKFFDEEYIVSGATNGDIRIVVEGKEKTINALSQVTIKHKDNIVGVDQDFL